MNEPEYFQIVGIEMKTRSEYFSDKNIWLRILVDQWDRALFYKNGSTVLFTVSWSSLRPALLSLIAEADRMLLPDGEPGTAELSIPASSPTADEREDQSLIDSLSNSRTPGFRMLKKACPVCGQKIPANWLSRHLKKEHPEMGNYDDAEDDPDEGEET